MSIFTRLRQGLGLVSRRTRLESDLKREVGFHLQMETDQLIAKGLSPEEARRTALRDFGGVDRTTEEVRDVRGITFWDTLTQDVRFGLRSLRRTPGYSLAATITLGLGIGANTAIFGMVNGVLLHPLPYADSGALVRIKEDQPLRHRTDIGVSIPEVWDYRKTLTSVDGVVEYHQMNFVLLDKGQADRVSTGVVSSAYFDVFGIKPLFGRTFKATDDVLGAEPVLILSNTYWLKHFGGDQHVVGQRVVMNDMEHTVIGILPPIPGYPQPDDVYMPTSACPFRAASEKTVAQNRRAFAGLSVFGRLKPGRTVEQLDAEVRTVSASFAASRPDVYRPTVTGFDGNVLRLEDEITQTARPVVWILLATTSLVLLIACANVANLALSRTLRRDRELALRTALGARRTRLIRQLLTEHTMLAFAGGLLGVAIAWASSGLLAAFAHLFTPRAVDASVDGTVLLFALGVSLVTGIGFGMLPALATRPSLVAALKDGGAQAGDNRRGVRLRTALVIAQVAVGFAVVCSAGLLLHSLYRLYATDLGYKHPERVLSAEVYGNFTKQQDANSALRFYRPLLERAAAFPGATAVAITNAVPQGGISVQPQPIRVAGEAESDAARLPTADVRIVSPDYFSLLAVPILAGRAFSTTDTPDALPVAIVNQSMAKLWGTRSPIGTTFTVPFVGQVPPPPPGKTDPPSPPTFTVVGVVGDTRQFAVDQPASAQFYLPLEQIPQPFGGRLLIRTAGDPTSLAALIRQTVREIDPTTPVMNVKTLEEMRDTSLTTPRLGAVLLGIFGVLALVITLAGLAAVIATTVSQRTREFGLRMALGASRGSVLSMVLKQGAWMVCLGLVVGLGGAVLAGQALTSYLYETPSTSPLVYATVAVLFVIAGLVACWGPARRATSIDPLQALREG